jgi:hypothetical protein
VRVRADDSGTDKGEADVLGILQPDGSKIITLNSPIENLNSKAQTRLGVPAGGGDKVLADLVDAGGQNFDGFASNWYGQTPNTNDATQSNASQQPQIVNAGSVIQENGRPAIEFDNSSDTELEANPISYSNLTAYAVTKVTNVPTSNAHVISEKLGFLLKSAQNSTNYPRFQPYDSGYVTAEYQVNALNTQNLVFGVVDTDAKIFVNNNAGTTDTFGSFNNPGNTLTIGDTRQADDAGHNGTIQEAVVFDNNLINEKDKIETNINNFYGIF